MEHYRYQPNQPQKQTWKYKARLSHCEIWEHCSLQLIAEAYPVQDYECTHARINRNKPHLVNSLGCATDSRTNHTYLLVERIPNRLSEVMTLNESQTLKILFAVLRGLQELEETYGVIGLTDSCICFNESGKVKIWVNSDLSSLRPVFPLKGHGDRHSKIVHNIGQIVNMVERKCFNSGFLRQFVRKLHQNKINQYWQAAEEILRIGELLFIVVEEKSVPSSTSHSQKNIQSNKKLVTGVRNENIPQKDSNHAHKTQKTQQQEPKITRKQSTAGHRRKFSNHQTTADTHHRRYQSFMDNQPVKNQHSFTIPASFTLNFNKFAQSQAFDALVTPIHKSAPLSPRQTPVNPNFPNQAKKNSNNNCIERKQVPQKQSLAFHKKQQAKAYVCEAIKEDNSQFDDSFSHNLKVDDKEILMSGEFQTFGILEDLSDSQHKKPKVIKQSSKRVQSEEQSISRNESDFDIQQMDLQIQKRLEKKDVEPTKQRISINNSLQTMKRVQQLQQWNQQSKPVQQMKLKTVSYYGEKENIPYLKSQCQQKRQKSPSMAYIDKKYEQYINKNQMAKNAQHSSQQPQKSLSRHSKHGSNLQAQTLLIKNKTNSTSNHNYAPLTSRAYNGQYRIPTDR